MIGPGQMLKWNGPGILEMIHKEMLRRLRECLYIMQKEAVSKMGNAINLAVLAKSYGVTKKVAARFARMMGSRPGEYPWKRTGHLRRGLAIEVDERQMVGRFGTNVLYGKFLEQGTKNMKSRPWLTLTIAATKAKITKILSATMPFSRKGMSADIGEVSTE